MKNKYQLLQLIQVLYKDRFDERMPLYIYEQYKKMSVYTLNEKYNNETLLRGEN